MNHNVGMQHPALLAWSGSTAILRDVSRFNYFGFTAEIIAPLTADTVFRIVAADGTDNDPCVPGTPFNVKEIPLCDKNVTGDDDALITFPAGTPVGSVCTFTIPCKPARYVGLAAVSGETADVRIVLNLSGPQI